MRLLRRRQRSLRRRQWPRAQVHARRLGGDGDLPRVAGVAALARLLRRPDAYRQLDQAADPNLLGVAQFIEHDVIEGRERPLRIGLAQLRAVRDGGRELCLLAPGP